MSRTVPAAVRPALPADVLAQIAAELRDEATVISPHVVEPTEPAVLGQFVAEGPRCAPAPAEYAGVIERIREGYLLHYGTSRLIAGADRDLALLAGDHLYALGLERLARLGDLEAVRELADLIALCAQLHSGSDHRATAGELWLATTAAIAVGPTAPYRQAKAAARDGSGGAAGQLRTVAAEIAAGAGLEPSLAKAAQAIESAADRGAL